MSRRVATRRRLVPSLTSCCVIASDEEPGTPGDTRRSGRLSSRVVPGPPPSNARTHAGSGHGTGSLSPSTVSLRRRGSAARRDPAPPAAPARRRPARACRDAAACDQFGGRSLLHDAAEIHDQRALADIADQRQVVADVDRGQAQLVARGAQQIEDAGADRNVQHRHRLVGHDQLGRGISARASTTRCNCPPDNSCGRRSSQARRAAGAHAASPPRCGGVLGARDAEIAQRFGRARGGW